MSVYLDYNASAPIDERVLDYMVAIYRDNYGNPDSRTHDYGENARNIVENARTQVAQLLNCKTDEVFFTSGATESNNIAIRGIEEYAEKTGKRHIITTSIEHKAVLESVKHLEAKGFKVDYLNPGIDGRIKVDDLRSMISNETLLVSVMHANNETGVIQPVIEIGELLKDMDVLFHVDATQSCGKLVEEIQKINCDILSLSAHKMSGPQGVGAIILRRKQHKLPPIKPIMFGGAQEHGMRPRTVPVALVGGLGKACEIALEGYQDYMELCREIKIEIIRCLDHSGIEYFINGDPASSMPNTINICLKNISSEALMIATRQYCSISNGSACTSNDYQPSYVLKSMGMRNEDIMSSIRISWGGKQDKSEIIDGITQLLNVAKEMQ